MNHFEELCKLASQENWCWKLSCTTCGHMHFRYAFVELANGKSPADPDWQVHAHNTDFRALGEFPHRLSKEQKQVILKECLDADLLAIAKNCRFPDWLGYLGLILTHTSGSGSYYQQLSMNWSAQLIKVVIIDAPIYQKLCSIANGEGVLVIADLEDVERSIDTHFKSVREK